MQSISLYDLGLIHLVIPAWQMAFYIGIVSFFMLTGKTKLCLVSTYLFGLYWGYYHFGRDFISAANGDPLVVTGYVLFGFALGALGMGALFYDG